MGSMDLVGEAPRLSGSYADGPIMSAARRLGWVL
jgi:hypothetical protein